MLDALCEQLRVNHGLYLEEMVAFLWNKFKVVVTIYSESAEFYQMDQEYYSSYSSGTEC